MSKGNRNTITVQNFKVDPLFPKIERAVTSILAEGHIVAPTEVLIRMGILSRSHFIKWSHGKVPYLEAVIDGNLTRLSLLLRILRYYAHDLNLVPTMSARPGRRRYTKTGDTKVEQAYARHFVWPGKGPFHFPYRKRMDAVFASHSACNFRDSTH